MDITTIYRDGECTIAFTKQAVYIGKHNDLRRFEVSGHGILKDGSGTRVTSLVVGGTVYVNGKTARYVPRGGVERVLEPVAFTTAALVEAGRRSYTLTMQ